MPDKINENTDSDLTDPGKSPMPADAINAGKPTGTAIPDTKPGNTDASGEESARNKSATNQLPIEEIISNNLSGVEVVKPQKESNVMPFTATQRAGFYLSKFILWVICGCLALLFIVIISKSFDASGDIKISNTPVSDSTFSQQKEIIKALQDEKKNYRDFILQIAQLVLLNLLLPTLTAVLGYMFGSHEGSAKRSD